MKSRLTNDTDTPLGPSPASSPACADAMDSLQRLLDGECAVEPDRVIRHRIECADCRSWKSAAQFMQKGLRQTFSMEPPAGMTERIFARMKSEPVRTRSTRWRPIAASLALAASILIVVFALDRNGQRNDRQITVATRKIPINLPDTGSVPTARLVDSIGEAGMAVTKLARETTRDNLDFKLPTLSFPKLTSPLERLEPAVASMQELQHGAVFSVAPITKSARRAVDLFWKEIGTDTDDKPVKN